MLVHMNNRWMHWALVYLHLFRVVVVGGCVVLMFVGWLMHIQWLLMASSCIAAGELLETTYYLLVLSWGRRSGRLAER
jgi:hypothetical protein